MRLRKFTKQMHRVGFYLAVAGTLATAQDVKQDAKSDIQSVGHGSWQRLVETGGEAAPRVQISSQVRIVLRGTAPGSRVTVRLIQRVEARNAEQAASRLTGQAAVTTIPGLTSISAQGSPVNSTLEIEVPARVRYANVEVQRGGDIEMHDFRGMVLARTTAGDIQGDNLGSIEAHTGGGHIRLGRIGGRVLCSTDAGSIAVASAGEVHCQTGGGEIFVKQAGGPVWLLSGGGDIQVDGAAQDVEAHSSRGAIVVGQAGGMVTADTRGGAIRVGSAAGVRAESESGPVHLSNASGPLSISTAMGSILATLMAGARLQDSSLVAPSGDITVMIPSNLALSIMATNETGGVPHLESDFSGVRLQSLTFGRPPLAQGVINGGGPVLLLSGSGMIYLRRINK